MFKTSYPCPVSLVEGGGEGRWGLCAMELVSLLTGEGTDRPWTIVGSVHPVLRDSIVCLNDGGLALSNEERADAIWPLLPSIMGTGEYGKGSPPPGTEDRYSYLRWQGLPFRELVTLLGLPLDEASPNATVGELLRRGRFLTRASFLEMTKAIIGFFWLHFGGLPQEDFTEEQLKRLNRYLKEKGNHYIKREPVSA